MENATLLDVLWIVIAAAMIMLMQGGFTLLETGLVRSKNSINVAIKNFVNFCVSAGLFWVVGFGIMFGASYNGWFGTTGFFGSIAPNPWLTAFFLFQMLFASTATTIISGAVAERMQFAGYLTIAAIVAVVIYPVVGHWVWGGLETGSATGWLVSRGFRDFAGGTAVHSVGGWVSLAACIIIGPRLGRYDSDEKIEGNNIPLATLGAIVLWFGWFGFNGGSTLAVTDNIPTIVLNTTMSGIFGGLTILAASWFITGKAQVEDIINGALAGLVGVTASADIVNQGSAIVIGIIASLLMYVATYALNRFKIDDAVGAFPVHGVAGIWGTLSVALFGDLAAFGEGVTRTSQFLIQLTGVGATFVYVFGLSFAIMWTINRFMSLRVSEEDERIGLNVSEHDAETALLTILNEMDEIAITGDLSQRVAVEPHTEVGRIAQSHNAVLERLDGLLKTSENERDNLQRSIIKLLDEVAAAADGDLTIEAEVTEDATGAVADSFNFMIEQLRDIVYRVQSASNRVNQSAVEIQATATSLAAGSEAQADQIVNTSAAVEEMSLSIQQVSENAATSAIVSEEAQQNARRGSTAVLDTIKGMSRIRSRVQETSQRIRRLGDRSEEVGEIVLLISDISERTSILALNASIQAALAGEHGKSFAVVAKEVERLAIRSNEATKQIETLIRMIQSETAEAVDAMSATTDEVTAGSKLATEAGQRLNDIETVSSKLADLIQSISSAAKQQARGSETIARAMNDISGVTQQTASGTRQATMSLQGLARLAEELNESVGSFKVTENGLTPA